MRRRCQGAHLKTHVLLTPFAFGAVEQVLSLYKKHVDQQFTWENFSVEEQAKIIAGVLC
jgi:hypothetical protein